MQTAEQKQLISLLDALIASVEELLLAGLTAASKSTVERIDVTFKEASRMKLLRLGSTLRVANEEIHRFATGSAVFSARRLAFFLGRACVLATSMRRAIDANDKATLEKLLFIPPTVPVEKLKAVTLGVIKRAQAGASIFEFRMRAVDSGEPLIWSCVLPPAKDKDLPAEAFLHLPHKQKFKPVMLLERKVIEFTKCGISRQPSSAARLSLSDASTVTTGEAFSRWQPFWKWNLNDAFERLQQHKPTPLDLEIELQEEVFLDDWTAGEAKGGDGFDLLPIATDHLPFEVRLDRGPSGTPLHATFMKMTKAKKHPPIFGVAHYESCRVLFQPLTALKDEGPEYLTISPDKVSQAALVKAMKFT